MTNITKSKNIPLFENTYTRSSRIIHTPSPFAKRSLFYLQEVGNLKVLKPHVSQRDHLSSYLFFVVNEGKGSITYKGQKYEVKKDDCIFIDCHEGYNQSSSNEELWSLSWLHFNGPTLPDIYNKYLERGGKPVFASIHSDEYNNIIHEIFSLASSDSYVRDMQIAEKITSLLSLLMQDAWNQNDEMIHVSKKRRSLKDIKTYIDQNYQEKMSLETLASSFYINKQYLSEIFKEEYGYTVNGYILQVRITKAKELLRFTDKTIDDIALEIGIDEGNYFSRMFKKVEGISPSQYRSSW